ncbi:MAG: hypothetical protein KFW09_01405 [Oscillospiraceae bacterium]|nr:hypothetical protein [Oscillospiraceae bacterium]
MVKNIYRYKLGSIFLSVIFFFTAIINCTSVVSADSKKTKAVYTLKMYEYLEDPTGMGAGKLGSLIRDNTLIPGQKFVLTMALDKFDSVHGIAGLDSVISYDSARFNYLGIPGAGEHDSVIGGDEFNLSDRSQEIFDLGFPKSGANREKLSFGGVNKYKNYLIEYPSSIDNETAPEKMRSIYSNVYYANTRYEKDKIFDFEKSVDDRNIIGSYLFEVKDNPGITVGIEGFMVDPNFITISYYDTESLTSVKYLKEDIESGNSIFDEIEDLIPLNPIILDKTAENITDDIDHEAGTRTITVGNLKGLSEVPVDTEIIVYDKNEVELGRATSTGGSLTVNIDRGTDDKNASINLGGSYKIVPVISGDKLTAVVHEVIKRHNFIKENLNMGELGDFPLGTDLAGLDDKADGVVITFNTETGLEAGIGATESEKPKIDGVDLGKWAFINPDDNMILGNHTIKSIFLDSIIGEDTIINKDDTFTSIGNIAINRIAVPEIILGNGNALDRDIKEGKDDITTLYQYYGLGFRDDFRAINSYGIDVTSKVERKVISDSIVDLKLPEFKSNERLDDLSDSILDATKIVIKNFEIIYSFLDIDGTEISISRKVKVLHRLGDIDRNGFIESVDRDIINDFVLGYTEQLNIINNPETLKYIIDITKEGEADLGDSSKIQQHTTGLEKIRQIYSFISDDEPINR